MIYLKIIVMLSSAGLFWWGGYSWHNARRFIMPFVITATLFLITFSLNSLWSLFAIPFLTLGYGEKSPLRHVFGDGWGRGVWGFLVALSFSLWLYITGHLALYFFLPYLALNFTLENVLKRLPQSIGDPIIGCGFASLLFMVSN